MQSFHKITITCFSSNIFNQFVILFITIYLTVWIFKHKHKLDATFARIAPRFTSNLHWCSLCSTWVHDMGHGYDFEFLNNVHQKKLFFSSEKYSFVELCDYLCASDTKMVFCALKYVEFSVTQNHIPRHETIFHMVTKPCSDAHTYFLRLRVHIHLNAHKITTRKIPWTVVTPTFLHNIVASWHCNMANMSFGNINPNVLLSVDFRVHANLWHVPLFEVVHFSIFSDTSIRLMI